MFRPIDLIVSFAVLLALAVGAAGVRRNAADGSVMIACADKLGRLAQSLVMYQGLYDGQFPRTRYDPAAPLTAYTGVDAPRPFADDGPRPNDVTAAMFLLARVMDQPPDAFTCPSALRHGLAEPDTFDRRTARTRSNFHARVNVNYALANMYPDAAAVAGGYSLDRFRDRLPAGFPIGGDTNPGGASLASATTQMSRMDMRRVNSPNHERDGQNVLFADGSVRFFNAPFVGLGYDNIFTGRPGTLQPAGAADTVLLPLWSDGPQTTPLEIRARRWTLVAAAVGVFAVLGWVVWHGTRAKTR